MASRGVNKVVIIGRTGDKPTVRYTPNGNVVGNVSVATSETWKDQQGQQQERTEWHRVILYGKLAEIAGQYLEKGSQIYFEGRLQTRKWTDQNNVERYTTEIVVDQRGSMQFLGTKKEYGANATPPQNQTQQAPQQQYQQQPQQQNQSSYPRSQSPQQQQAQVQNNPNVQYNPGLDDTWDDSIPF